MKKYSLIVCSALLYVILSSWKVADQISVSSLRCELLTNPIGIDELHPRLGWEIAGRQRGIRQTNYQILVASSLKKLDQHAGDVWDSGIVSSDQSVSVPYTGKPLQGKTTYYWKVRVITNVGQSAWSEPANWSTGLLDEKGWQAKWTGLDKSFAGEEPDSPYTRLAARYFRKDFKTAKPIRKAMLYLSGLGLYELHINGMKIGDQVLAPTPTDYSKSVKYNTFDVTGNLQKGANAIGLTLGNGRFFAMRKRENYYPPGRHWLYNNKHFGFPKMLLQLEIEYADGTMQRVLSDDSWKVTANGPIRTNNEFDGEEYDALKEMPGWDRAGFDDSQWLPAELVEAPPGKLEAQLNKNIRVMETLKPIAIHEVKQGTYILDMGQNMVGWLRMKVRGRKGNQVILRFSETLQADGTLYMANIREAQVTDKYMLKGEQQEVWEPAFTYHGFRYAEISGYPGKPTVDDFEGRVVYDEMETTGSFKTSDTTINQIYKNAYWGIRGNYRGMPTDCPQRDERMGWLGDRAVGSLGESFIFNNNNLYAKWLDDIEQAQLDNGSIPDVAPNYWDAYNDNMTWPAAYINIANMLYEQYGNLQPIEKHYPSMKKWLHYMREKYMVDNIMTRDTYGDWCVPPERPELIHSEDPARKTDGPLLGTAFYYRMARLMEHFAMLLHKKTDAEDFARQAAMVREAFNSKYLDKENGQYSNNAVTANLIPLCFGMVPTEYEEQVFKNIVHKTENDFNGHVSTGLIGIQWLMRGLTKYGRPDLAVRIATNRDYPGWGYMIEQGATTIWELWNGNTADPAMNSGNHVMLLGDLVVWFYENLAGIRNAPGSTAFKKIEMHPCPEGGLAAVNASFQSVHGLIKSAWKQEGSIFQWNITVPANSTARIFIPAKDKNAVTESGKNAITAAGVTFQKMDDGFAVFELGSGDYAFSSAY